MSNRKKIKKVRDLAHRAVHVAKINRKNRPNGIRCYGENDPLPAYKPEEKLMVTPFEMQVLQSMEDGHWESAVSKELSRQGITLAELADHLDVKVEVKGAA